MNPANFPVLRTVFKYGAQDRVLDTIMLLGPVVVLGVAVIGRNPVTEMLMAAYVFSFVVYVVINGLTR